jgi:hypothetical protein
MAVAVSGQTVYTYSRKAGIVSEVGAQTNHLLHRPVPVSHPVDLRLMGPVLAADHYGAWVVGRGHRGRGVLTLVSPEGQRSPPITLGGRPVAVVTGLHEVWVLDDGTPHDRLIRIDPVNDKWSVQALLPPSPHIDTLAFGFGHLWAVDSKPAILYRIDARSNNVHHLALGPWQRAGRPVAVEDGIWIPVRSPGIPTQVFIVDPNLEIGQQGLGGVLHTGMAADRVGAFGSLWGFGRATGELWRWDPPRLAPHGVTPVTYAPSIDGSCITSLAAADGAVWVTLAPSFNFNCSPY